MSQMSQMSQTNNNKEINNIDQISSDPGYVQRTDQAGKIKSTNETNKQTQR